MARRLISFALCLAACGPGKPPADLHTVTIAAVIDRTGINSEPSWADAIKLAERNANAGLKKATALQSLRFSVVLADSGNEPSVALSRSADAVNNQGARALIVDTSQVDVAVNRTQYDDDLSNDLAVPIQCGSCTSGSINNTKAVDPDPFTQLALRNGQGWNFRSIMSTKLISQILVRLMLETADGDVNGDGKFKIAYLGSDEVFGRGAVKDLRTFATALHPSSAPIIEEIYHPRDADPNSYDWSADVRKLVDNQTAGVTDGFPDAVVVADFAQQQSAVVKAYRQGGSPIRMLHYHTFRISSALQSLGSLGDGVEGVSHVLLDNGSSADAFVQSYEERYGVPVVYRDAIYYDNAMTLMLATAIAAIDLPDPTQVTGAQIRDAMKKTSEPLGEPIGAGPDEYARAVGLIAEKKPINYQGASGPMDYDATGNVVDKLARYTAQDGQFVDVAKYDCVSDASCPEIP